MASDVKWIKITTDIFNDEKIKLIEAMPDSDVIIVIWFKLLSLAGRSNNNGLVLFNDKLPYTIEMLESIFNRKRTTIKLALDTFEAFNMIEYYNEIIMITNWEKHQNKDGLDKIKEQNRLRQERYREKQKNLYLKDKEVEEDKDIDIEGNVKNNVTDNVTIPYKKIVDYLNEKVNGQYRSTTNKTKDLIKARWNEGFRLEDFKKGIDNAYNHWSKSNDFSNMKPATLFNGGFEGRVTNDSYSGFKQEKKEVDWRTR